MIPADRSPSTVLAMVVERIPGRHKANGEGSYMCCCPAHEDKNPSLSVAAGRKGVVLKCFAGCSTGAILQAIGMEEKDLFYGSQSPSRPAPAPVSREPVSLPALARKFRVDQSLLKELGLAQAGKAVTIPYFGMDGTMMFRRRRLAMEGKKKYIQPSGIKPVPYGLQRLSSLPDTAKAVMIVEGESDCWALWSANQPALGVPGASLSKVLQLEHVQQFDHVFIFEEPDQAGGVFQQQVGERLREVGFKGGIKVCRLRGAKDPAELWAKGSELFRTRMRAAIAGAGEWNGQGGLDDYVVQMSTVKRKPVTFLWEPYIPNAFLTIMAGKPGLGKSFIATTLAAQMSAGGGVPGASFAGEPSNVLLFSAEDDPEYVLAGRLEDAGGDLTRVYCFDVEKGFNFGDGGYTVLDGLVRKLQPKLVVFDPIVSFTGNRVDINRQTEVRGALQPLMQIARASNVPMLLIAHVSKSGNVASAIDAIMGSVDFSAAPRSALMVYPDPDAAPGEEAGILAHPKHNLSREGRSLRYVIDSTEPRNPRLRWRGESDMKALDLAGAAAAAAERSTLEDAKDFLRRELTDGVEQEAKSMTVRAKGLGISMSTLTRARTMLGITTRREGFGSKGKYYWRMPEGADERNQEEMPL